MSIQQFPASFTGKSVVVATAALSVYTRQVSFAAGIQYDITCDSSVTAGVSFYDSAGQFIESAATSGGVANVWLTTAASSITYYVNTGSNVLISIEATGRVFPVDSRVYTLDTVSATGTYTPPAAGFANILILGGGGGGSYNSGREGGSGGGSGYATTLYSHPISAPVSVVIGSGGSSGAVGGMGGHPGGTTSFGAYSASGGAGGVWYATGGAGGSGGGNGGGGKGGSNGSSAGGAGSGTTISYSTFMVSPGSGGAGGASSNPAGGGGGGGIYAGGGGGGRNSSSYGGGGTGGGGGGAVAGNNGGGSGGIPGDGGRGGVFILRWAA